MARVNDHYLKLKSSYLFSEIARRIKAFQAAHPEAKLIRLGIGDVTGQLRPAVIGARHEAVDEMARSETFGGYPRETGWNSLLEAIARHDYEQRGVKIATDEIVVSDGSKTDTANIQEIFAADCVVALTDPVYPVYLDSNVMAGRRRTPDPPRPDVAVEGQIRRTHDCTPGTSASRIPSSSFKKKTQTANAILSITLPQNSP